MNNYDLGVRMLEAIPIVPLDRTNTDMAGFTRKFPKAPSDELKALESFFEMFDKIPDLRAKGQLTDGAFDDLNMVMKSLGNGSHSRGAASAAEQLGRIVRLGLKHADNPDFKIISLEKNEL